ncbi:MAG: DUF3108 domain-containing protein [Pseudomonadota bacterium]
MEFILNRLWLVALMACTALPAWAEQSSMSFDVRLLGARVGLFTIAANSSGGGYAARSKFTTVGLVGALKKMEADVTVQGRLTGGRMQPVSYVEAIDDGTRVSDVVVKFAPGTPRLVSGDTGSSAPPASGAALNSAIDPLTGLVLLLSDQDPSKVTCVFTANLYDGHRLAKIELTQAEPRGTGKTCHGTYQRVSGYTSSERRSRVLPLAIDYVTHGATLRAEQVRVDTRYGPAVVKRR